MLWLAIVPHIPKGGRYTLGARIENKFLDLLEQSYLAYFTIREKRLPMLSQCVLTLDVLKFLVTVGWEGKLITHKQYAALAPKLDEIGKMLGGWRNSLKNSEKKSRTW